MGCLNCKGEIKPKKHSPKKSIKFCSRECYKEYNSKRISEKRKEWYLAHPDYDKKYFKKNIEKKRVQRRKWREDNLQKQRDLGRTDAKKYAERHPERVKAQQIANNKIKIPSGTLCERCQINFAEEKHHPDYLKPLEVIFLCQSCHKTIHLSNKLNQDIEESN